MYEVVIGSKLLKLIFCFDFRNLFLAKANIS